MSPHRLPALAVLLSPASDDRIVFATTDGTVYPAVARDTPPVLDAMRPGRRLGALGLDLPWTACAHP